MTWADKDGIVWASKFKDCPDCGRRFQRWSPGTGQKRPSDGCAYGSAYCRECMKERVKESHQRKSGETMTCEHCGKTRHLTILEASQRRSGHTPRRFCSSECHRDATRKWESKREAAREAKRRQRANRHARGLTSNGNPITGKNRVYVDAFASRRVPPTGVV